MTCCKENVSNGGKEEDFGDGDGGADQSMRNTTRANPK
jgi:hypothetical protein